MRPMTSHLDKERSAKIADGAELLTPEEIRHVEECSDCVEEIAVRIRERVRIEKAEQL